MDKILRQIYREFNFPVGIMTTIVKKDSGCIKIGDYRGCTISSFRVLEDTHCTFNYNKTRIMASALDNTFAFHYLHTGQEDIARRFAINNMNCSDQFDGLDMKNRYGCPVLPDFHSLIIGSVQKKIDISDGYFYFAKIQYVECRPYDGILHYAKNRYI